MELIDKNVKEATDTCEMGMGSTMPNWSESGIETKVERLGDVVRNIERELTGITKYMNQLIGHSHANGKVVKELSHPHQIEEPLCHLSFEESYLHLEA